MADPKTKQTAASVSAFIERVPDARRREDARKVSAMMRRLTGADARMWGGSIVGFGTYTYEYSSGRSGDWPLVGFSPRAKELVLYIMSGFDEQGELVRALGPCKTGKSCLYIRSLSDIDLAALERLIEASIARMVQRYHLSLPASAARSAAKVRVAAKPAAKTAARTAAPARKAAKPAAKGKPATKRAPRAGAASRTKAAATKAKPATKKAPPARKAAARR